MVMRGVRADHSELENALCQGCRSTFELGTGYTGITGAEGRLGVMGGAAIKRMRLRGSWRD